MAAYPQSVAYTRTFNAYLASDHVSPATGLTIVVTLSKNGGAYAAAGGTVTEISNGLYKIALTTTDTNTIGDLAIRGAVATMDDVKFIDQVTDPIRGLGAPTALPGVAAGAANGLPINGTNLGSPVFATTSWGGLTSSQISTYAGGDSAGTTTLLGRVSAARAGYFDNLSGGAVMLASSYTAPDNTSIATILTRTDVATSTRMATFVYTAPPSAATISGAVWSATGDGAYTYAQKLGYSWAFAAGTLSGVSSNAPVFVSKGLGFTITATQTADGRSVVTLS